jgi:NADH-quinone oxidoreductase subunit N
MSNSDWMALMPLLMTAAGALIVLLLIGFRRAHGWAAGSTIVFLVLAIGSLPLASAVSPHVLSGLLVVDSYTIFFSFLILAASFVVVVLSYRYLEDYGGDREEYYVLLLLASLGSLVLAASRHFAVLFLGLEILSVSLYVLIAYIRSRNHALESGLKYLILAAVSSALLVFGMALIYAELGALDFVTLAERAAAADDGQLVFIGGFAMMIAGVGFKLAVVPFHMWTPDVYQGAPAPVTAFIATVSKGGVVALLLRFLVDSGGYVYPPIATVIGVVVVSSILFGNFLALLQDNVKRLLAYSSIAHFGYLLVPVILGGPAAVGAVCFYLVTYFVSTLGAFGVVTSLSSAGNREREELSDYRGLFWRRPGLATVFTAMLFSLAGIPLTAGFMGKFMVIQAGARSALWGAVLTLVVGSVVGIVYYLRIVVAMYSRPQERHAQREPTTRGSFLFGGAVLAALTLVLIWLGTHPSLLLRVIETSVRGLAGAVAHR